MEISEAREVRVRQGDARFVFLADHATGRLVVREEDPDGAEVCALTVGSREELAAFLTGLRRVLGVDEERRLAEAYERGVPVAQLARDHQRSERAVDMRLQELGLR